MKITIFGDSIAKGLFLDKNNLSILKLKFGFASMLGEKFNCSVQNNSVFGQTLKRANEKNLFDNYLAELNADEENIAIIELGGNDADFNWDDVQKSPDKKHVSKTGLQEFCKILTDVLIKLKNKGVKVFVCSLFPISSERYFDNVLAKKYDGEKILQFLKGDKENLYRFQESYNNTLIKCVQTVGVNFVDYRSEILLKTDFLNYLSDDGIHPNENGQKFIYETINEKLKSI